MMMYPLLLDAEQLARDVVELLFDETQGPYPPWIAIRRRDGVAVRWYLLPRTTVLDLCAKAARETNVTDACRLRDRAEHPRVDVRTFGPGQPIRPRPVLVFSGVRLLGAYPAADAKAAARPGPGPVPGGMTHGDPPRGDASSPPIVPYFPSPEGPPPVPYMPSPMEPPPEPYMPPPVGPPPIGYPSRRPTPTGADTGVDRGMDEGVDRGVEPDASPAAGAIPGETDTLLAIARVTLPAAIAPAPDATATLVIGLGQAPSPTADGVMRFESARNATTLDIGVMVEAPDFTCASGWKHTLTVPKSDPFTPSITLDLVPLDPADRAVRTSTVRVHYTYLGQPAGAVVRTIVLGDASAADLATVPPPVNPPLQIAATQTPVDLTIRIARRDQSDAARELIWTLTDCAFPIALPDASIPLKVGDRDTASSFASKVTSQVNSVDGTVRLDNMMRSIGTLIRRAMPPEVITALKDVSAAVGPSRLARVLLLTDECHVPWELALLDAPPRPERAPYLGAQFAVSRWLHGEADVPVQPPASLTVSNLAVVLGSYEATRLAPLPHAKEESAELAAQAAATPEHFPHVTSVEATPDSIIDLLNGTLQAGTGTIAPELVHFACHGEVLGTGVAKRSILFLSDGTPLEQTLFAASTLAETKKSFLFMNACQVGVGGEELGQYAGFPGLAIAAGFSGFVGPLWSVNDQIAKGIALDFYRRAFGADGSAPRPVADVLADMRSQYASEPDPKKRQSTWLAYVYYGHPHFTFTQA